MSFIAAIYTKDVEFQVSEEVTTVQAENWYGKYEYNALDNKITAVDFYGTGTSTIIVGAKRYERIINTKTNQVYMTNTYVYPVTPPKTSDQLPKQDFGTFK